MLNTLPLKGLPAAVCTIYDPRYPDPVQRRVGTAALYIINDCIFRQARYHWRSYYRSPCPVCRGRRFRQPDRAFRPGRKQDSGGDDPSGDPA